MTQYCIYCGRPHSKDNPVVNNVCLECMIKRGVIVKLKKSTIRASLCKICGSVKIGLKWVETRGFEEAIDSVVKEFVPHLIVPAQGVKDVRVKDYRLETSASWRTLIRLYIEGVYGGKEFLVERDLTIVFSPSKCPRCIMYDSREFEAVVQIRGFDLNLVSRMVEKIIGRDHRILRDLVDTVETSNGIDLYFYNHGAARKLARRLSILLKASLQESFEEAGIRSGRRRSRLYISLKPSDKSH